MKKFIIIFVMMVLAMSVYPQTGEKKMKQDIKNFKIEIIKYYFGRENIRIIVTHEQLMSESSIVLNQKDYTLIKRVLTHEESSGIKEFLSGFPLDEFKENYYYKGVKDGTQLRFVIKIDDIEKSINVANYFIVELGELVDEVIKLLPEDHINYNRERVPEVIAK